MKKIMMILTVIFFQMVLKITWAEDIAVIVNKSSPYDALTIGQLKDIYLLEMNKWPNKKNIVPLNRVAGADIRIRFFENLLREHPGRVNKYYDELTYRNGVKKPPLIQNSGNAVKKFIAHVPNAIGYIYASEVDESVKVVTLQEGN